MVTNLTSIENIFPEETIRNFVKYRRLPRDSFFPYVHEFCHHYTFLEPVGFGLTILLLKSVRAAREQTSDDLAGDFDFLKPYLKFHIATEFLRPISEALALYAEFDVMPSEFDFRSMPLAACLVPFGQYVREGAQDFEGWSAFDPSKVDALITSLLVMQRSSLEGISRKFDSFVSPLAARDGYLSGYMLLKNVVRISERRRHDIMDPDAFFGFIVSYFFADADLLRLLCQTDIDIEKIPNSIAVHIQRRIHALYQLDFEQALRSFIADPRRATRECAAILQKATDELLSTADTSFAEWCKALLGARRFVALGKLDVAMRSSRSDRVVVFPTDGSDIPLAAIPLLRPITVGETKGRVELFQDSESFALLQVLICDGRVIDVFDPNALRQAPEWFEAFDARQRVETFSWKPVAEQAIEKSSLQFVLSHFEKEAVKATTEVYKGGALIFVPDTSLRAVEKALADHGYWGLLGSAERVRQYAFFSLMASLNVVELSGIEKMANILELSLDGALPAFRKVRADCGLGLIDEADTVVRTCY